jgi:adenylosuccinate synthase
VAVRYALELNGADGWIVTNLDVLSGFERSTSDGLRGRRPSAPRVPADLADLASVKPVHTTLPAGART